MDNMQEVDGPPGPPSTIEIALLDVIARQNVELSRMRREIEGHEQQRALMQARIDYLEWHERQLEKRCAAP